MVGNSGFSAVEVFIHHVASRGMVVDKPELFYNLAYLFSRQAGKFWQGLHLNALNANELAGDVGLGFAFQVCFDG